MKLADLDAQAQGYPGSHGLWTRGLLVRRSVADGACAFFATWWSSKGSAGPYEDSFETAKAELGLVDHNESRSWHGWHRHVSLVMLATVRHRANQSAPQKTLRRLPRRSQPSFAGRSRKSAGSPPAWHSAASGPPTSSPGHSGAGRAKPPPNAHI